LLVADTVGIRVIAMKYRNVISASLIADAYFTIGSVSSFGVDISLGEGYIALAVFGRCTHSVRSARVLFGFTRQLQSIVSSIKRAYTVQPAAHPVSGDDHRAGASRRQGPRPARRRRPVNQALSRSRLLSGTGPCHLTLT
jgi:hypothetical protein